MKHLTISYKFLFLFLAAGILFTSCDPDLPLDDNATATLLSETGFISSDATITSGESFTVRLRADKGTAEMNSLTIQEGSGNLSTDNFTIVGFSIVNNPQVLIDGDRTSFEYDITITPTMDGENTYTFLITSADMTTGSTNVTVTSEGADVDPILTNNMNATIELQNPGKVQIVLTAIKGSSPLSSIAVYQEGVLITDLTRLEWETAVFTANPLELPTADKEGFTDRKLFLRSQTIVGTTNYTITLTDENAKESSINYAITLLPLETPISEMFLGVSMFNNAGAMFGAIDLDAGVNVSSGNATADIVDLGIDGDGNWLLQVGPLATTVIRTVDVGITFDGVVSREGLTAAFDAGVTTSAITLATGSVFAAKIGDDYYLLSVATATNTTANNNDFYTFDIKKSSL